MKAKTEELLYFLLWNCDTLMRPTFRNLTDSFESWAYRNGFRRQLADLERRCWLESRKSDRAAPGLGDRVLRLTEAGRLHALGGRDPEAWWRRAWDGRWHLVLFDLPATEGTMRNRLRNTLRQHGFGWLQNSVWVSPHPLKDDKTLLAGSRVDVKSLLLLEARPSAGETDQEIVAGAWDFAEINRLYSRHQAVLNGRPIGRLRTEAAAKTFRNWGVSERTAWLQAISADPLLPQRLLPKDYLGQTAWRARMKALGEMADQVREFRPEI